MKIIAAETPWHMELFPAKLNLVQPIIVEELLLAMHASPTLLQEELMMAQSPQPQAVVDLQAAGLI